MRGDRPLMMVGVEVWDMGDRQEGLEEIPIRCRRIMRFYILGRERNFIMEELR
jgi:hypothetical protein